MRNIVFLSLLSSSMLVAPCLADSSNEVPGDFATIQGAIDAASSGDEILVQPGTFFENLDFKGKDVRLVSAGGPSVTTIDGSRSSDTVVLFASGETQAALLSGFTIRGGRGRWVAANGGYRTGGGLVVMSSPTIRGNVIRDNQSNDGGGIAVGAGSSALIENNLILDNVGERRPENMDYIPTGGGILIGPGKAVVRNNTIVGNRCLTGGGGIGVLWPGAIPLLVNNIVAGNRGGGVEVYEQAAPVLRASCIWDNPEPLAGEFACADGCISQDPLFADRAGGDFHLRPGSPCIDRGSAGDAPDVDVDGDARPCWEGIDLGADEYCGEEPPDAGCPAPPVVATRYAVPWPPSYQCGRCQPPRIMVEGEPILLFEDGGICSVWIWIADPRPDGQCAPAERARIEEKVPPGWVVDPATIAAGGSLDPARETITWDLEFTSLEFPTYLDYVAMLPQTGGLGEFHGLITEPPAAPGFPVMGEAKAVCPSAVPPVSDFGSIQHWLLLGPFQRGTGGPTPGIDEIRRDYLSDGNVTEFDVRPRAGEAIWTDFGGLAASTGLAPDAKGRNPLGVPTWLEWRDLDDADDRIDFPKAYGYQDDVMCYALAYLIVEQPAEVRFGVSNDDSIQVLLDGTEIFIANTMREGLTRNYKDIIDSLRLSRGTHVLVVKVFQGSFEHNFRIGFVDASGAPIPGGPPGVRISLYPEELPPLASFKRGDVNGEGKMDISDAVAILGYLFIGGTNVLCEQAGDVDDSGVLDISDAVYLLSFLFLGGKPIEPPVETCGIDPTPDELSCDSFAACQ